MSAWVTAERATVGAPPGRHAAVGMARFWTPLRVVLLLATVGAVVGWLAKSPCIQTYVDPSGHVQLDWRDGRQYRDLCYSDTVPLYTAERLDTGGFVYATSWVEDEGTPQEQVRYEQYPVLTGLFQWINARATAAWQGLGLPAPVPVVVYFTISALWLGIAWTVTVGTTALLAGRRRWDAVLVALSPLVCVHVFTNFDALVTAFAVGALLAWARRRPALAGVLIGLGTAAKLYPMLLLGPLLVVCLRTGHAAAWLRTAGAAAGAWLAVNLPIMLLFPDGWRELVRLHSERGIDPDTLYNVAVHWAGWTGFDGPLAHGEEPTILNAFVTAAFGLCCLGIGAVALTARRRPRVAQLAFLVVAAFLLTSKVWSPQWSLWLVPLAVLALPRWRLLFSWMAVDALLWVPRMYYYLGVADGGLPIDWFLGAVVMRDAMVLVLCALVIREIYRPELDRVRRAGVDDPTGGLVDGAPDRVVLGRQRGQPAESLAIPAVGARQA